MSVQPKILAFAGSLRKDSYNKKLVKIAVEGAKSSGAIVNLIDLRDYPLPILDQDIEVSEGLPKNALELKRLFRDCDGLLIASPEYNSSLSAALKNVIDWVSRPESKDEPMLDCFQGKVVAIMSASMGGLGGVRGLLHLRSILGSIKMIVVPDQVTISTAHLAFDSDGMLKDKVQEEATKKLGVSLVELVSKIHIQHV